MKYIEKSRIEKFLNLKGYQINPTNEKKEDEKVDFLSWIKSPNEQINMPRKDIFQSNELPTIFKNQDLLKEFRKF
jgi:hypothetical protein